MVIKKIVLHKFKRFALKGIDHYELIPTSKLIILNWSNGVGKSSLLSQLNPLPAELKRDFYPDGYKEIHIDHNNKLYVLDIEGENSISLVSDSMFASLVPGYNKNFFERVLMACNLKIKIKSEKLDNQKCYVIEDNEQKAKKTVWITKDRKNPIKAKVEFENGEVFEYDYELKFLATKLRDVELPDTKNYTLINYETGEVILDGKDNVNLETNTVNEDTNKR